MLPNCAAVSALQTGTVQTTFWIFAVLLLATGRKWGITFTTLATFGGAFFASFPLFYSTSFGGAYWVWMAILHTFVVQAVSYEFRVRRGNLLGSGTFSVLIPFVLAYIVWAWRVLDREPVKEPETNED